MLSYQIFLNKKIKPSLQGMSKSFSLKSFFLDKRVCRTIPFSNDKGSATVEASLVVPIFIFAAFAIFSLINVLITKEIVYEGLQETAQYFAEYQYIESELTEDICNNNGINFVGTNPVTAKVKIKEYIDDADLVEKYISGGLSGLNFKKAIFKEQDGYVYLELTYSISVNMPVIGSVSWKETEQIKQKAYLGLQYEEISDDDIYVYVAETGEVYHKSRDCYHIKLTIKQISENSLNTTYSNYEPCEYCAAGKSMNGNIYITETGNKYHYSIGCSGLKRTVTRVKLKDVSGLMPCSACGN